MIMVLGTHFTRASDVIVPDFLTTDPAVPITPYRDLFGNWCSRIVAPVGRMRLAADGMCATAACPIRCFHPPFNMRSKTCPPIPWSICSAAAIARPTVFRTLPGNCSRTLRQAGPGCMRSASSFTSHRVRLRARARHQDRVRGLQRRQRRLPRLCPSRHHVLPLHEHPGALLHRLSRRHGDTKPWAAGDFAGWFEAYLGGRWHTFDPRNFVPRIGRDTDRTGPRRLRRSDHPDVRAEHAGQFQGVDRRGRMTNDLLLALLRCIKSSSWHEPDQRGPSGRCPQLGLDQK